jgi:hypothetical protein
MSLYNTIKLFFVLYAKLGIGGSLGSCGSHSHICDCDLSLCDMKALMNCTKTIITCVYFHEFGYYIFSPWNYYIFYK